MDSFNFVIFTAIRVRKLNSDQWYGPTYVGEAKRMFAHQKNHVSIISVFNEFRVFFSATHAAIIFALLFFTSIAQAGEVEPAWDPNTQSTLGDYKVYYGQASGNYSSTVTIGRQTVYITANLQDSIKYYFSAVAYNTTRTVESDISNEVGRIWRGSTIGNPSFTDRSERLHGTC